ELRLTDVAEELPPPVQVLPLWIFGPSALQQPAPRFVPFADLPEFRQDFVVQRDDPLMRTRWPALLAFRWPGLLAVVILCVLRGRQRRRRGQVCVSRLSCSFLLLLLLLASKGLRRGFRFPWCCEAVAVAVCSQKPFAQQRTRHSLKLVLDTLSAVVVALE